MSKQLLSQVLVKEWFAIAKQQAKIFKNLEYWTTVLKQLKKAVAELSAENILLQSLPMYQNKQKWLQPSKVVDHLEI